VASFDYGRSHSHSHNQLGQESVSDSPPRCPCYAGAVLTWIAPAANARSYISVEISNGKGGLATGSFSVLSGATATPQTGGGLSVTPIIDPGLLLNPAFPRRPTLRAVLRRQICGNPLKAKGSATGNLPRIWAGLPEQPLRPGARATPGRDQPGPSPARSARRVREPRVRDPVALRRYTK
jgi:hypothetical protein